MRTESAQLHAKELARRAGLMADTPGAKAVRLPVNFARWGIGPGDGATAPGYPLTIRGFADLGRRD